MNPEELEETAQPKNPGSVFRDPAYTRFWFARICSTVSFQISAVAVGWQVYALTHSTFALGMVGLVQFMPMLLLTLVVGHVGETVCQEYTGEADPGAIRREAPRIRYKTPAIRT